MPTKFAKKILRDLQEHSFIQHKTFKDFAELTKEECISILKALIVMENNQEVKRRLIDIFDKSGYMHDKSLLLLSI